MHYHVKYADDYNCCTCHRKNENEETEVPCRNPVDFKMLTSNDKLSYNSP